MLTGEVKKRLEQIIKQIAHDRDWFILELSVQPDTCSSICLCEYRCFNQRHCECLQGEKFTRSQKRISASFETSFALDSFLFRFYRLAMFPAR